MPRLPDVQVLGERDPRASYAVPSMPRNPLPGAIEGLGAAIAGGGDTIMRQRKVDARIAKAEAKEAAAEVERAQRFANTGRLLEFEKQERDYLTKASENVSPGAADFTKGYVTGFEERARKFFADVPKPLKDEFDLQLYKLRTNLEDGAKKFEREEGRRYYGNKVNDGLTVLLDQQRQSVDSWAEIQLRGESYIDDLSPELFSAAEKDEMKRTWKERRVISWAKDNPEKAQQALDRAAPAGGAIINSTAKAAPGWRSFGPLRTVSGLVIHHTAGSGDVDGVVQTFKERGYPAHYVIDREGNIHQILSDGAQGRHIKTGAGGLSNANTLGVEIIAKDDSDVTPAQVKAAQQLYGMLSRKYGLKPDQVYGHGEINSHKQASEGQTVKRSIVGYSRGEGGAEGIGVARKIAASSDPRTAQLDFVVHELGSTEKKADALLRGATTIEQAVDANLAYERPSIPARENRIKYGNAVLAGKAPKEAIAARDYLVSKGYTPVQASGFVGGLMQESGLNLNAGIVGDAGASVGIAQWNGDRRTAMEAFTGGTSSGQYASIPPELQGVPYETLQTLVKREKASYTQSIRDDIASIRATGQPVIDDPSSIANGISSSDMAEWVADRERAKQFHAAVEEMHTLPDDAIAAKVASMEPEAGAVNYASIQADYEAASRVGADIIKQRATDPAGYVYAHDPAVKEAWEAFDQTKPETARTAIAATIAAQETLGIAPGAVMPLPAAQAAKIVQAITDEELPAENRLNAIVGIASSTPDETQQRAILRQMVKEGGPSGIEVVYDAYARGDTGAARRLFSAVLAKPENMPGKGAREPGFDDAVFESLAGEGTIGATIYGLEYNDPSSVAILNRDMALAKKAATLAIARGADQDEAITQAVKDIQGDGVLMESDLVNVRGVVPSDLDQDRMANGMSRVVPEVQAALQAMAATQLAALGPVGAETTNILKATTANEIEAIMETGAFRNHGEGWGFFDARSNSFVAGPDGKPLVWTTEQLMGMADASGGGLW